MSKFVYKVIDPARLEYFPRSFFDWSQEKQMEFTMSMAMDYKVIVQRLERANKACTGRLAAVGGLCGLAGFVIGWLVFGG